METRLGATRWYSARVGTRRNETRWNSARVEPEAHRHSSPPDALKELEPRLNKLQPPLSFVFFRERKINSQADPQRTPSESPYNTLLIIGHVCITHFQNSTIATQTRVYMYMHTNTSVVFFLWVKKKWTMRLLSSLKKLVFSTVGWLLPVWAKRPKSASSSRSTVILPQRREGKQLQGLHPVARLCNVRQQTQ